MLPYYYILCGCYRGKAKSLFSVAPAKQRKYKSIGALPRDPSPSLPPDETEGILTDPGELQGATDRLVVQHDMEVVPRRTETELFKVIKELLKKEYQAVEEAFYELDEQNTRRLSQETMYMLLKK